MQKFIAAVLISTAIWGSGLSAKADLIVNGSFELPNVGGPGTQDYYLTVAQGEEIAKGLLGWVVAQGNVDVVDIPDLNSEGPLVLTAYDGDQVLDLHGFLGGVIYQDVLTVPGQGYVLSFAYSSNPYIGPLTDTATVSITDEVSSANLVSPYVISHDDNAAWLTAATPFVATGAVTRVAFTSPIPGQSSLGGIILDAVAVQVPEPSAMALAAMGLVGLVWAARRR